MESYKIKDLSFTYPNNEKETLKNINLTVSNGEFITICGKSGCGKTTLLRLLKPSLSPFGKISGEILFNEKPINEIDAKQQTAEIGFIMQNPDNQIVTDKVWHELAFGMESLGCSTQEIRTRVAEMASFFGIQAWFHKKITDLSGGQKQLLNLASVMVMQPSMLILDEPTSQLDPIAAQEFLKTLEKINRELGTTVILTEHRLEEAIPISDRVIVMDEGRIIVDEKPESIGKILKKKNHDMYLALPVPMIVYEAVDGTQNCPLNVRDGRCWLEEYSKDNSVKAELIPQKEHGVNNNTVIKLKDVWFRYKRDFPDVIKNLNMTVNRGEIFAVVGGNGTGKTTTLSLISGLYAPYRGEVLINGTEISKIHNLYSGLLGVLPQNPQSLFVKKTVHLDLMEMLSGTEFSKEKKEEMVNYIASVCRISGLLDRHPYDLSGGEQQRAALAKVLLTEPEILLLDEPTKGMDAHFKEIFADILIELKSNGVTVLMVSHDIEFCAEYADRCAMFFDGNITSCGEPSEFFAGKSFYTTAANRMARTTLPMAILADDIIIACGGFVDKKEHTKHIVEFTPDATNQTELNTKNTNKLTLKRIVFGSTLAVTFLLTCILGYGRYDDWRNYLYQFITIIELALCLSCFIPQKEFGVEAVLQSQNSRKLTKRTIIAMLLILIAIPLTIYIGVFYLQDRKYYFISLVIILETLIPFCLVFESRKPEARELIIISTLCAIAISSRTAFFALPQFKPVLALVIISGVCFGGESGFLIGAITGFVSNFFFGQGPWTPWQMFAFGIIGFAAGILFRKGIFRKTKASLCLFGAFAALVFYGGIMNTSSVLIGQYRLSAEVFLAAFAAGMPMDIIHSVSTALFLWFLSEPMIDKLERIKVKYGLIER